VWYGWTGSECTDFSTQTYVLIASTSLQGLVTGFVIFGGVLGIFRFYKLSRSRMNAQLATLLLILLTAVFICSWRWTVFANSSRPEDNILQARANDDHKIPVLVPLERAFIGLSLASGTAGVLNVSLLWIQVAMASDRMSQALSRNLVVFKRTVLLFELILILIVVGAFASGNTGFAAFGCFPFLLTYGYGAYRIADVLPAAGKVRAELRMKDGAATETIEGYNQFVARIQRTATLVC